MAQVKIKLDVWNDAALKNIQVTNQKLVELQVNGQNISVGNPKQVQTQTTEVKKLDTQIKNVNKSAQKAGQSTSNALTKNQQKVNALTKDFKQVARGVNDLIHSFINPMTIILVAFEAATKVFNYFFKNLTENIDKLASRSNGAIKNAQRNVKQFEERAKSTLDLIKKLDQLNQVQDLNNEQMRLGQSILARINRQFKDLGITLDQTTGKYKGLYEAQIKVNEQLRQQQSRALRTQITAQRGNINAALKKAFGSGIELGKPINGNDLFTLAERLGGTLGAQNADLLARKWGNGTDLKAMRDIVYQLQQGLAQGQNVTLLQQVIDAFDTAIDYTDQLKQINSATTLVQESSNRLTQSLKKQRDALKDTREQTEKLKQSYEDQQRANSLAGLDPEDRANALRAEVEALNKRNEALKKAKEFGQKQLGKKQADSYSDLIDYDATSIQLKQFEQKVQKQRQSLAKLIAQRDANDKIIKDADRKRDLSQYAIVDEVKVNNAKKENIELNKKISSSQAQLNSDQKKYSQLRDDLIKQQVKYQQSQSDILQTKQGIANIDKEIAKNELTIQSLSKEALQIEKELEKARAEAELAAWKLQQDRIKNYSDFVNDLMKKQIEGLNEILGKKKDNLLLELKTNAEKVRGRKLTEEQLDALKSYVDVMSMQDQLKANQKLNFETNGVISNDLARKGGWASSVVVDRAQDINKEILNTQRTQVEVLSQLKETMDKSNELLKQFSVIQ